MKKSFVIASIAVLAAMMLSSAFAVNANSGNVNAPAVYHRGTICGDAQLGGWAASQYIGRSNFQGYFSIFIVNNLVLSGGNTGSVSSTSGSLSVYNTATGALLFYAAYSNMHGDYSISGTHMALTNFRAGHVHVSMNKLQNSPDNQVMKGSFHNVVIPNQNLPCKTSDQLVSFKS